jgi:hypothetical protein
VALRTDLGEDPGDLPFFIDHEGGALNPHHLLAVHVFFFYDPVGFGDLLIRIGEQGIRQVVLLFEFLLLGRRVSRYAKDHRASFLNGFEGVAEPARFYGSTGGVSLGIKKQDHALAGEVFE